MSRIGDGNGVCECGTKCGEVECLEALSVHDGWARLVILLLGDPHLLEGGQGCKDGATDPHRVLPLGRCDDLDLYGAGCERGDLLLHPVGNAWVHGSGSGQHSVGIIDP